MALHHATQTVIGKTAPGGGREREKISQVAHPGHNFFKTIFGTIFPGTHFIPGQLFPGTIFWVDKFFLGKFFWGHLFSRTSFFLGIFLGTFFPKHLFLS